MATPTRHSDTVVVSDRETGLGVVIAVIVGVVALLAAGWFLFFAGDADLEEPLETNIEINEAPEGDGDTTVFDNDTTTVEPDSGSDAGTTDSGSTDTTSGTDTTTSGQ